MSDVAPGDGWNASGGPKYPGKVVQSVIRNFPQLERDSAKMLDLRGGSGVHTEFLKARP